MLPHTLSSLAHVTGNCLLTLAIMMVSSPSASLLRITPLRLFKSPMIVPWNSVGARTWKSEYNKSD